MDTYKITLNGEPKKKSERAQAVALGYNPQEDLAPRVVAIGKGVVAEKIIAVAKENGIPIREDTALTLALAQLDLDEMIPPELYSVIAEVLAYVYRVRGKQPDF